MTLVDDWLTKRTTHQTEALENASRHFDDQDALDVYVLEGVYGQESDSGRDNGGKRGGNGPRGPFALEKDTATRMGLGTSAGDDQRFDIDEASSAAAEYLEDIDDRVRSGGRLQGSIGFTPVSDVNERVSFDLAAYNGGEAAIAKAQQATISDGGDPTDWAQVRDHLEDGGMTAAKAQEVSDYVEKIRDYAAELKLKSPADASAKKKDPLRRKKPTSNGAWRTLPDGTRIQVNGNKPNVVP